MEWYKYIIFYLGALITLYLLYLLRYGYNLDRIDDNKLKIININKNENPVNEEK